MNCIGDDDSQALEPEHFHASPAVSPVQSSSSVESYESDSQALELGHVPGSPSVSPVHSSSSVELYESVVSYMGSLSELSDNSIESLVEHRETLRNELKLLLTKHTVSHRFTNELLKILKRHGHSELPADRWTLLQSPKNINVINKCGGTYK